MRELGVDDRMIRKGGVPLALWAATTVGENSAATPFDMGALTNPFRTAYIVDRICMMGSLAVNAGEVVPNFGQTLRVRFTLGHASISQDWIPIWSYGPRLQDTWTNTLTFPGSVETTPGLAGAFVGGREVVYSTFLWKLPKPLIVPPGTTLIPSLIRGTDGLGGAMTCEMAYLGRRMPPGFKCPSEIDVPYVGRFLPPEVAANTTAYLQSQDRVDMTNPFDVPLRVRRLVYRLQVRGVGLFPVMEENDPTLITLFTTSDQKLVDNIASRLAFDRTRAAWTTNFDIPPSEGLTLRIPAGGGLTNTAQYTFSVVGTRKERV